MTPGTVARGDTDPDLHPDEVRDAVRAYFADHPGTVEVRAWLERTSDVTGFDRDRWAVVAGGLGIAGLCAPVAWDGAACGIDHAVAIVEECGAALYPGPARGAVLVGLALDGVGPDTLDAGLAESLARVVDGRSIVGIGVLRGTVTAGHARLVDGRVDGVVAGVTHGGVADVVFASVEADCGTAIVLVAADRAERVVRTPRRGIDTATPRADLDLVGAPAVVVARGDEAERVVAAADILSAAEQNGGARACLSAMVEHASVRTQFGAIIGTFQAVAHRCADVAVTTAGARALVGAAAAAYGSERHGSERALALLARADAGDAFLAASDALIQVAGGMGFTWEHDAHLFFRRARASATVDGIPDRLRHDAVAAGAVALLDAAPDHDGGGR